MSNDELGDELMTRFLVDDVTAEERDRVEQRFMDDPEFFAALTALDDEILLSYVRGGLSAVRRRQLEAALAAAPARRRRLDDLRALNGAMSAERATTAPTAASSSQRTRAPSRRWFAVAAALVSLAVLGTWLVRRPRPPVQQEQAASPVAVPRTVATFFLQPGNTRRALEPQANVFRVAAGAETVTLALTIPIDRVVDPQASLALVRGAAIETSSVRVTARSGSVDIALDVPAQRLPPGDYVLTIQEAGGSGRPAEIASRFFTIAR